MNLTEIHILLKRLQIIQIINKTMLYLFEVNKQNLKKCPLFFQQMSDHLSIVNTKGSIHFIQTEKHRIFSNINLMRTHCCHLY